MTEKDVYQFYNEKVKIVYSEIEARNNLLPVELLFEIHSAFDHLKRFHIDGEEESLACEKAYSHLKRGLLDAFKLKLKFHNDDYKKLVNKKADLRIIDSGEFLPAMLKDRSEVIECAKNARLSEGNKDVETAFGFWNKTSSLIDKFEERYFNSNKISWAQKQSFFHFSANFWVGVATGIVSSVIVTIVFNLFFNR